MENIEQLIQQATDQDLAKANGTFADIMAAKMNDALDQERIRVSGQIYNGLEAENTDEEQLELDLEDDDDVESEEDDLDVDDEDDTEHADEDSEDD